MINLIAQLSRSIPLLIALVALAAIVYFVVSWRSSPTRAKEVLIRLFTVLCSALAIFFTLASLYALADGNQPVLELAASFAAVGILGLVVTLICRWRFKKNHPHYRSPVNAKATPRSGAPVKRSDAFWWLYDVVGKFRPKK